MSDTTIQQWVKRRNRRTVAWLSVAATASVFAYSMHRMRVNAEEAEYMRLPLCEDAFKDKGHRVGESVDSLVLLDLGPQYMECRWSDADMEAWRRVSEKAGVR